MTNLTGITTCAHISVVTRAAAEVRPPTRVVLGLAALTGDPRSRRVMRVAGALDETRAGRRAEPAASDPQALVFGTRQPIVALGMLLTGRIAADKALGAIPAAWDLSGARPVFPLDGHARGHGDQGGTDGVR